jgi:hypothetical protein
MIRVYRLYVEVRLEGDVDSLPPLDDVREETENVLRDPADHNFDVTVIGITTETRASSSRALVDA